MIFAPLIVSLLLTVALIPLLSALAFRLQALDQPNPRKMHTRPIPKVGGMAMGAGVFVSLLVWAPGGRLGQGLLAGLAVIFLFGLIDDLKDLSYRVKFTGQILAAAIVIGWGGLEIRWLGDLLGENAVIPRAISIPLTLVTIVGVTNAINLADGLDGLAGGIMLMAFICTGYLAYRADNAFIMIASTAVIGAIFGFLRYNTYPATVFMGDTGSQMIGFMGICLCLTLTQPRSAISPLFPILLLGLPVLDTLTVMTERLLAGISPFKADKRHLHHKLITLGLFHTEAVFVIYVIQAVMITLAYAMRFHSEWSILCAYLAVSAVIVTAMDTGIRRQWKIPRFDLIDKVIKGRLRQWRERQLFIKIADPALTIGAPSLWAATNLMSSEVPWHIGLLSALFAIALLASPKVSPRWSSGILRTGLYLITPAVFYLAGSGHEGCGWIPPILAGLRHCAFGLLMATAFLTIKFTRRLRGFKATPTDFLVVLIALAFPLLMGVEAVNPHYGTVTTEVMILLYAYEVVIGECRGRLTTVNRLTAAAFAVPAVNALL